MTNLPPHLAEGLTKLARQPFPIVPVRAAPGKDTTAALVTLRGAANAAGSNVLWLSRTQDRAEHARADGLADTATLATTATARLTTGQWQLPAGTLVVVDDAASTTPEDLATLARHATDTRSKLILIDNTQTRWPPGPSARTMALLENELPWAVRLTRESFIAADQHPRPQTSTPSPPKPSGCRTRCSQPSSAKHAAATIRSAEATPSPTAPSAPAGHRPTIASGATHSDATNSQHPALFAHPPA